MSRAQRRAAISRRGLERLVSEKRARFEALREQGYSKNTMATKLGFTTSEVEELCAHMAEHEGIVTSGGGG